VVKIPRGEREYGIIYVVRMDVGYIFVPSVSEFTKSSSRGARLTIE